MFQLVYTSYRSTANFSKPQILNPKIFLSNHHNQNYTQMTLSGNIEGDISLWKKNYPKLYKTMQLHKKLYKTVKNCKTM